MAKANDLKVLINTDDLYSSNLATDILSIRTFYEQQWLDRGKKIKYFCFSLEGKTIFEEPDVEIPEDDYRSYSRSKK